MAVSSQPLSGYRAGLRRLWQILKSLFARVAFFATAIAIGMTSSWFSVHRGLPFNTETFGPWVAWHFAGQSASEPYTRGRFAMSGGLPLSGDRIVRLEARFDDDGRRLHSSCVYEVSGQMIDARWWTLAAFDSAGRLIPNEAQRYGWNTATTALGADGRFSILLGRDAHSGNWLPTGAAGRMVVIFEIQEPAVIPADTNSEESAIKPPSIKRISC